MAKIPIIMNVDTGIDDAFAMALASASEILDIRAVTTSFGNNTVEQTTENTLRIAELLGLDARIAAGAAKPLLIGNRAAVIGSAAQGEDGLGNKGALLPYPTVSAEEIGAAELMAEVIAGSEQNVVIVSTCALTNVAVLLLAHPELKGKIDGVAFSGGALYAGNILPTVEANVLADPEAAQIVFKSGLRVLMCPIDVTGDAYFTFEDRERFKLANTRPSAFLYEAMRHYSDHYENLLLKDGSPLHDAVPVAWLINPEVIKTKPYRVEVDLCGYFTYGATVADTQGFSGKTPNVAAAVEVDRGEICAMVFDALKKLR